MNETKVSPDKDGRISLNLKVCAMVYNQLAEIAKAEDRSVAYIARRILTAGIVTAKENCKEV